MKVAFIGPAKSGKSLACRICKSRVGGIQVSFAAAVKEEVFEFLKDIRTADTMKLMDLHPKAYLHPKRPNVGYVSLPPLHCPDPIEWVNAHKDELRPLLQWWGGDFRRGQDKNYWIKKVAKTIENNDYVFIDDLRYLNEAEYLYNHGFTFIGIKPLELDPVAGTEHSSEKELYQIWDVYGVPIIENDKVSFEKFEDRVLELTGIPYMVRGN